jgi:hypothetical protein
VPTFATPGPILATVVVAGAQVRVNASDRPDAVVLIEPIDPANPSHVKVAAKTKVSFACGQLTVKTTASGEDSGSIAITIDLPAGSGLVSYLAHSGVQAVGSLGDCELHMASGRVDLDQIKALQANVAGGSVSVGRIAEDVVVNGARFALRIGSVEGAVKLSSSGGQVWIGHAHADLDLSSGNASFEIDRADGSVAAQTGAGSIRIGRLTRGHAELANHAGNISVGVSAGSAAAVDADSKKGSVCNVFAAPQNPDHEVTVHARTRHGDITIQSAASLVATG